MEEMIKWCRVCLIPEEEEKFTSLFDKKGNFAQKINSISGIKVSSLMVHEVCLGSTI